MFELVLNDPDIGRRVFITDQPEKLEQWYEKEMAERKARQAKKRVKKGKARK